MVNIVIIVQARMGSTRLPGKIIKEVLGTPLLIHQYRRLSASVLANEIVIATTENTNDIEIENLCNQYSIPSFRGSENDVLKRYYDAAKYFKADVIVRVNSDCPLIDPKVVDYVISSFLSSKDKVDYASNILEETYPLGMHVEVFSKQALENAFLMAKDIDEREHVTPFIYRNPSLFKLLSIRNDRDLSNHRWTIDYEEDLEFFTKVFEKVIKHNAAIDMNQLVFFLEANKKVMKINSMHKKQQNLL